jgi:hypothetical protein
MSAASAFGSSPSLPAMGSARKIGCRSEMSEQVNHPDHYGGDTTYEAIKVIENWQLGFHLGNTVKYICRAGKKSTAAVVEDLKKARWYLDRYIAKLEKEQP